MNGLDRIWGQKAGNKSGNRIENIGLGNWPFEVISVKGEDSLRVWHQLHQEGQGKFYPILLGPPDNTATLLEGLVDNPDTPQDVLARATRLTAQDFFDRRVRQEEEYYHFVETGKWPVETVTSNELIGHIDLTTRRPYQTVLIASLPTPFSWEVPAFLKFGGWNECPPPEEHVVLLQYWQQKYGAEIVTATPDLIECVVSRPPNNKDEALELAQEQFIYCPDIVYQGTQTLSVLAAILLNSNCWYFWWD